MATVPVPAPAHQPPRAQTRATQRMFSASDDMAMMKQIQATHAPDGRLIEVKPILKIIESIFQRATPSIHGILNVCSFLLLLRFSYILHSVLALCTAELIIDHYRRHL